MADLAHHWQRHTATHHVAYNSAGEVIGALSWSTGGFWSWLERGTGAHEYRIRGELAHAKREAEKSMAAMRPTAKESQLIALRAAAPLRPRCTQHSSDVIGLPLFEPTLL